MTNKRSRDDSDSDSPPPLEKIQVDSDDEVLLDGPTRQGADDGSDVDSEDDAPFIVDGTLMEPFKADGSDDVLNDGADNEPTDVTPREERDAWLESLDEKEARATDSRAFKAAHRAIESRSTFWDDSQPSGSSATVDDLLRIVVGLLHEKENPRQAMDRFLGRGKPTPSQGKLKGIRARKREDNVALSQLPKDTKSFDKLTEAVDGLVSHGMVNALEEFRESFARRIQQMNPN